MRRVDFPPVPSTSHATISAQHKAAAQALPPLARPSVSSSLKTLKGKVLGAMAAVAAAMALAAPLPASAEVKVGVSDWPGWVAWYVAEQKGFFKKHGADVKLV